MDINVFIAFGAKAASVEQASKHREATSRQRPAGEVALMGQDGAPAQREQSLISLTTAVAYSDVASTPPHSTSIHRMPFTNRHPEIRSSYATFARSAPAWWASRHACWLPTAFVRDGAGEASRGRYRCARTTGCLPRRLLCRAAISIAAMGPGERCTAAGCPRAQACSSLRVEAKQRRSSAGVSVRCHSHKVALSAYLRICSDEPLGRSERAVARGGAGGRGVAAAERQHVREHGYHSRVDLRGAPGAHGHSGGVSGGRPGDAPLHPRRQGVRCRRLPFPVLLSPAD